MNLTKVEYMRETLEPSFPFSALPDTHTHIKDTPNHRLVVHNLKVEYLILYGYLSYRYLEHTYVKLLQYVLQVNKTSEKWLDKIFFLKFYLYFILMLIFFFSSPFFLCFREFGLLATGTLYLLCMTLGQKVSN